jgi:glycosyltransferase involved in cell wall biosynthesis
MARGLIDRGHSVIMVCGSYEGNHTGLTESFENGQRRGVVDGIDVIEFDLVYSNSDRFISRIWTFFKYALRSIKIIFKEKYDVVFATTTPLTAGIPGIVARRLRKKPFVFEVRDLWPELPKAMGVITNPFVLILMSALEWLSYHSADRLIALSPGIAKGIQKRGVDPKTVTLIPNGCDLDIFDGSAKKWRPEGITSSDLLVLFAGAHGPANGLSSVLDAAAELKLRERNDIKFLLVGDGKLKPSLVSRALSEQLDNVLFHKPVNKIKLAGLMRATDLGLQTLANIPAFYYGTSPNKFFDYISAGVPTLNNYPGWLADMISENNCGFCVQPENAIAFADALEKAANDRPALTLKGANAKRLAVEKFDRKIQSSEWVDVLELSFKERRKAKL